MVAFFNRSFGLLFAAGVAIGVFVLLAVLLSLFHIFCIVASLAPIIYTSFFADSQNLVINLLALLWLIFGMVFYYLAAAKVKHFLLGSKNLKGATVSMDSWENMPIYESQRGVKDASARPYTTAHLHQFGTLDVTENDYSDTFKK